MYVAEKKSQFYVVDRLTGTILAEVPRHPEPPATLLLFSMHRATLPFRGMAIRKSACGSTGVPRSQETAEAGGVRGRERDRDVFAALVVVPARRPLPVPRQGGTIPVPLAAARG